MQFRKKPVVIEAYQVMPKDDISSPYPEWLLIALMHSHVIALDDGGFAIGTLEGTMRANVGDWVIKGVKGELYPCKPDIFAATYEQVTP